MKLMKNKYILTITCDKNDGDDLTKVTTLDVVPGEYFNPELFVKMVKVLQKLCGRISETYKNLGEDDIKVLYEYDTYNQDADWIERLVAPIGKFAITDDIRDWDSNIVDLFPIDSEHLTWKNEAGKINECHSVKEVQLIWIDENGMAWMV